MQSEIISYTEKYVTNWYKNISQVYLDNILPVL